MNPSIDVRGLANAYRAALQSGGVTLNSKVESSILRALVASSAEDTRRWINETVPDGDRVAEPLKELIPDLQHKNYVGKTLDAVRDLAIGEAKSVAKTGAFTATAVMWFTAITGAIGGIGAVLASAGETAGYLIAWVVLSGAAFLGLIFRGFGIIANKVASSRLNPLGDGVSNFLSYPSRLGRRANAIFMSEVGAVLVGIQGQKFVVGSARAVLRQVRAGVGLVILVAIVAALVGCAIFVGGVYRGATNYWNQTHKHRIDQIPIQRNPDAPPTISTELPAIPIPTS